MTKETIKEEFNKKELGVLQKYMFERASKIKGTYTFEDIVIAWDKITSNEDLNTASEEKNRFGANLIFVINYNEDGSVFSDRGETYRKWKILTEDYIKEREYQLKGMIISRKADNTDNRREQLQLRQLSYEYSNLSQEYNEIKYKLGRK